jgi:hypothetical protein
MDTLKAAGATANLERKPDRPPRAVRRSSQGSIHSQSPGKQLRQCPHSYSQPEIFMVEDHDFWERTQNANGTLTEEDKAELRKRTEKLFALVCEANTESIACVTHKVRTLAAECCVFVRAVCIISPANHLSLYIIYIIVRRIRDTYVNWKGGRLILLIPKNLRIAKSEFTESQCKIKS